jgi:iron complex outermembrane receptor protein
MRLTHTMLGAVAVCTAVTVFTTPALAQQEPAHSADTMGELLVTARKKQESLHDAPVAVTAFTAETMSERQIRSVEDIARFTPGFVFSKAFGRTNERPVVRGQSNILAGTNPSAEAGAAYFVDGVYYPGDILDLDLQDVERVEVMKGPQSALYGRNTYSGAINFVTRGPTEEFSARVAGHFDDDEYEGNLSLGGHFTETLGASLTLRKFEFDGQWENNVTGETVGGEGTESVSGVLDFQPTEAVSLRLRASYSEDRDDTRALFLQPAAMNNCMPGTRSLASYPASDSTNNNQYFCGDILPQPINLNTGPRSGAPTLLPGVPADVTVLGQTAYNEGSGVAFSGVERDLTLVSLLGSWDIVGGTTLTLSTAYRDEEKRTGSDSDHSSVNLILAPNAPCFLCASDLDAYEDFSAELRLSSSEEERFRWTLGAFHFELDQDTRTINFTNMDGIPDVRTPCPATGPFAGQICSGSPYRFLDVYTDAYFGSLEFDITQQFTVTGELRYEEDTKAFSDLQPSTPASPVTYDKETFENTMPRLTLRYMPSADLNFFAIYAEGVKPGGSNGRVGTQAGQPQFQQEESKNYELGVKSRWGGRVTTNLSLYFTDVTNQQLTTPVAIGAGATTTLTSIVTNQGNGEVKGAELELSWAATDTLLIGLTYALTDSEYTEGCDGDQFLLTSGGGTFNAMFPADQQPNNLNGQGDCSIVGHQFPLTSENTASVTVDFDLPLRNDWNLYVNADATYESEKPVQVHNLAFIPEATVVGMRIGVETANWSAGVYGRNILDEDAPTAVTRWLQSPYLLAPGALVQPNTPPTTLIPGASYTLPRGFFGSLRRERQVGLEFNYNFGGGD